MNARARFHDPVLPSIDTDRLADGASVRESSVRDLIRALAMTEEGLRSGRASHLHSHFDPVERGRLLRRQRIIVAELRARRRTAKMRADRLTDT